MPSLLLIDDAPEIDVFPVIKNHPEQGAIPIIAFTVHGSKERRALDAGADGFVEKPFKVEELRRVLKPFLDGHR